MIAGKRKLFFSFWVVNFELGLTTLELSLKLSLESESFSQTTLTYISA